MAAITCSGVDVASGEFITLRYGSLIAQVNVEDRPPRNAAYLAPGWIDLQVNGYAGVDYNSLQSTPEQIAHSIRILRSTGTTRFLPTVITGDPADMLGCLRHLSESKKDIEEGESIAGFHVEGPHISPEDGPRGAHPARWVRPPSFTEFQTWQEVTGGAIRLVTLSPEWPEAPAYIERVAAQGVTVSIGHTAATAAQISDAVRAGASKSTHLGNGAHAVLPRHPNYLWEQLAEDRLTAGFIVDGIHLGEAFFRAALRCKTVDRALLVTDASMPACAEPGIYRLGEQEVELTSDGRVVLRGQTRLAGSSLRMDRAIENVIRQTGASLPDAVRMAALNPARVGQVPLRQLGLIAGELADLVEFDYDPDAIRLTVLRTVVGGREVYRASL